MLPETYFSVMHLSMVPHRSDNRIYQSVKEPDKTQINVNEYSNKNVM